MGRRRHKKERWRVSVEKARTKSCAQESITYGNSFILSVGGEQETRKLSESRANARRLRRTIYSRFVFFLICLSASLNWINKYCLLIEFLLGSNIHLANIEK